MKNESGFHLSEQLNVPARFRYYPLQFAYILNKLKSGGLMYTYELLETGCYYLVKEKEESPVKMIQVAVESDHCLYIQHFDNPAETCWKMKKETLFDIIECLTDETVQAWQKHYNIPSEDIFYEDEDE